MKKFSSILVLLIVFGSIILTSCSKDDNDPGSPTLAFTQGTGYVSADTSVGYGVTVKFGITVNSNGTDNLVKFQMIANATVVLDSTINTNTFSMEINTSKTVQAQDVFKFVATDFAGNNVEKTITLTGDFGEINTYNSIVLGAQDNPTVESFVSYSNSTATKYFQAAAFENQAAIDMFCFYENTASNQNLMSLAAPGSNITGIFEGATSPENYTTKNTTYFVKTSLTAEQFDAVSNDAIILALYDTENDFRKAKQLTAGDVYCFKLQSGKYGLYKVVAVTGAEAGTLEIAVKIQK